MISLNIDDIPKQLSTGAQVAAKQVSTQRVKNYYYTSEEFFLYKITVDKRTIHHFSRQNELLTGT